MAIAIPVNRREAEAIAFGDIEAFCNPRGRHSSLGLISLVAFENKPA